MSYRKTVAKSDDLCPVLAATFSKKSAGVRKPTLSHTKESGLV